MAEKETKKPAEPLAGRVRKTKDVPPGDEQLPKKQAELRAKKAGRNGSKPASAG